MATEYEIVKGNGYRLLVCTHGGKLDLDWITFHDYENVVEGLEPKELAAIGLKIVRAAMCNYYGDTDDNWKDFKKWLHEEVDGL